MPKAASKFFAQRKKEAPLLLLILLVMVLRIPTLFEPYWYGDEAIYLTLGEGLRQGLVWYRDLFDHKPPLIYLFAAWAGSVFWFRLILLFWHAATLVLFWELAKTLFPKKPRAVILASSAFAILTTVPLLEGNIANAEIFMIGPTIAALLLVFSAKKLGFARVFLAGVLFSVSTLFKVPAAFDLAALASFWVIIALWDFKKLVEALFRSIILGAGFLLPILLTVLYYWSQGALVEYLSTAWFFNFDYITRWGDPAAQIGQAEGGSGLLFRAQVLAGILLVLIFLKKFFDKRTLFAATWFSFALFAILLPARPYPHYLIQGVPPLSLLLALLVFGKEKHRFLSVPFLLIFTGSLVFYQFYYYPTFSYYQNFLAFAAGRKTQEEYFKYFDRRVPQTYDLAEFLRQRTAPNERVFIWGTAPEVYALSRRLPPGRFVTSFHIGDIGAQKETLLALEKDPPRYIIVLQSENRSFPGFRRFLLENYILIDTRDGAEVWKKTEITG